MTDPFYFISYSRTQLYFAESVAVQLQRMKVGVWFDLQQLKTGEDWASEIKRGLDECAGVILIVSQRSLASKYVELEWKAVLDAGKPVYLLYFEPAELTDERLKSCPAVDGRGRFKAAMRRLTGAITEGTAPHETAPVRQFRPPKRFARVLAADDDGIMRFPTRLAPGVLMITLSVLGISITLIPAMLMIALVFGIPFSLWLGILAGYGILASSHYARRKLVGAPPNVFVVVALLGALALLLFTQTYPAQQRTQFVFTVIIAVFAGIFGLAYLLRGGDLLRWTLTGFANERVRRWYHGGRWMRRAGKGTHAITYRILHSRGDEKFGRQLVKAMQKFGHGLTAAADDHPDQFTFFLLSNVTVWDEVRTALKTYPRLIGVAMTTVSLPQDVKDQMGRFQYLDARTDARGRFQRMAASLTETQVQRNTLSASIETTPTNLDITLIPRRVQAGLGSLRLYAVVGFVAPVLVLLQLLVSRGMGMPLQLTPLQLIISLLAALVFAIFCFFLDYLAKTRQVTTRLFIALYAGGMIVYSIVSSVVGGIQLLSQTMGDDLLSIIPSIIVFLLTSAGLFAWLPALAPRALSTIDLRAQFGGILRQVIGISIITTYAAFVILTTSLVGILGAAGAFSVSGSVTTAPVFTAAVTSGNLSVRFPQGLRYVGVVKGQLDPQASFSDLGIRADLQAFVTEMSQAFGDEFTPTFAGYAAEGHLNLLGGQFTTPSPILYDYAAQQLARLLQHLAPDALYQPDRMFGSGASAVQGAFAEFTLPGETDMPLVANILAIDTATAHHLIYIVRSDTPAMRSLLDQFYALLASSP